MGKIKHINARASKHFTNVAFLSLGGNTGPRLSNLGLALEQISLRCGKITKTSPVYETEAWGHRSKNLYLNQVIKLSTAMDAPGLLAELLEIEKEIGRRRGRERYTDRVIDIDLLYYNNQVIHTPQLAVPHPRLHLRKFVLVPLSAIDKKMTHPVLGQSTMELLNHCPDQLTVKPYREVPEALYICIEGNIGSGKSTLAEKLAAKLGARYVAEKFEKNHLLPLFYESPKAYAFPLEYSFLIDRFNQLKAVANEKNAIVVSDFSIYKCLWFAKANLKKSEYRLFEKHFGAFSAQLKKPDLVVRLKTGIPNLKKNIGGRGRAFEKKIADAYLKKVERQYDTGFKRLKDSKTLEINVAGYHPKLEIESIKIIQKFMKESFGWQG